MSKDKIFNFLLYQVAWVLCVVAAAAERPGLATAFPLAAVGTHLILVSNLRSELRLVLGAAVVGLLVDSVQLTAGVFSFPVPALIGWLSPPWIIAMWMLFAITLRFCLSWLREIYLLASIAGFIGGPLAFAAGERFGAVTLSEPRAASFLILGGFWACALPLLVWLAWRGRQAESPRYRRLVVNPADAPEGV